ncbi:adenosylcobinamide kinase /adenosylcobinamide-phosphate guanylyltransferase [Geothermobacter ehrlichii]|uniref:Adenosylcobinamide kinase n=1 Tax=Geothermobacter ehrlichii TaxID=213224 RepID=A0A5D3WJI7_9BACT|nr:bifunctional adenosylcobinamide kinase/adenosylcobinamide-phosphate guanylyltransferase [Geothermobacter ehrlichii]TYO98461.1 adenosylcobinamide kinase /adenosylcobinamide-phosphate guanylyltransferase [Geothermobacter ehrlichii]
MAPLVFVTGGARSGKSTFARRRCEEHGAPLLYVATATIEDDEMACRVERHRQERGDAWRTLEEPLELARRLPPAVGDARAVLIDCLTLWLSNQFFACREQAPPVLARTEELLEVLLALPVPVYLVSNEVGSGIVPDNRLARLFRDLAGEVNQMFAARAHQAWLLASGLPLRLK